MSTASDPAPARSAVTSVEENSIPLPLLAMQHSTIAPLQRVYWAWAEIFADTHLGKGLDCFALVPKSADIRIPKKSYLREVQILTPAAVPLWTDELPDGHDFRWYIADTVDGVQIPAAIVPKNGDAWNDTEWNLPGQLYIQWKRGNSGGGRKVLQA